MKNKQFVWSPVFLTISLLLNACTTLGPDFQTPDAPKLERWQETDEPGITTEGPTDDREWWKVFNDPVLDRLIDTAYRQNLDLRIAGLRILQGQAQLAIAVGAQYPQNQQAFGSATRTRASENPANTSPALDQTFNNYELGFQAGWELDFWGRFRRNVESAEANLNASVADYDNAMVSLTAEVARAYLQIRTFEQRIRLAQENVKLQQRSLDIVSVRFRNGAVSELDVQQAKSLLFTTKSLVPELQRGLRQTQNGLAVLLGMMPGEIQGLLDGSEDADIPAAPAQVAVGLPADLLLRRPDIRSAELTAAVQNAQIGIAQADLYPSISLAGQIGVQSENGSDLFETDSLFGSIGPGFSWNILNYGRIKNNVRLQDAGLQQLLVDYSNTVLKAYQEVENAQSGFLRTQEQERYLADSVKASERSVAISMLQYREGMIDYNRVTTIQGDLVDQQDQWTQVRGGVVINLVSLYKALGGGWQIREGKPFVPAQTIEAMRNRTDWGGLLPPEALPEGLPETPKPAAEQPFFQKVQW